MWNVIWKQKGVYQEDSKAVTEEKLWSCSHFPPSKSPILPLVTPIKNNLSVVLILQSKLLNVFAACHGRAIWLTNNTLHSTAFLSFLFYTGYLFQISDFPTTPWPALMAGYKETHATQKYHGLKCCAFAMKGLQWTEERAVSPVQGTVSAKQSCFKTETWLSSDQIIRTGAGIQ